MRKQIDTTFFDEAILEIGEYVNIYSRQKVEVDEYGKINNKYHKYQVWGSLQPESNSRTSRDKGSNIEQLYNFYCGSEFRIYIDDLIETEDGEWLQVYEYTPWDVFGVREIKCRAIKISKSRDFQEFREYYEGKKTK